MSTYNTVRGPQRINRPLTTMDERDLYAEALQMNMQYRPPQVPALDMQVVRDMHQKDRYLQEVQEMSPQQEFMTSQSERQAFKAKFGKKAAGPPGFQPIDRQDLGMDKNDSEELNVEAVFQQAVNELDGDPVPDRRPLSPQQMRVQAKFSPAKRGLFSPQMLTQAESVPFF